MSWSQNKSTTTIPENAPLPDKLQINVNKSKWRVPVHKNHKIYYNTITTNTATILRSLKKLNLKTIKHFTLEWYLPYILASEYPTGHLLGLPNLLPLCQEPFLVHEAFNDTSITKQHHFNIYIYIIAFHDDNFTFVRIHCKILNDFLQMQPQYCLSTTYIPEHWE